jgi:uncharacterized protein YbcI
LANAAADTGTGPRPETRGEVRSRISDGIVALLKEYYGRGPEEARVYYVDDIVVCLLRGGFTRIEQTLLNAGRRDLVIEQRLAFQEVMEDELRGLVQEITGRRVITYVSGNQPHPELTSEVFVLGPADGENS